MICADSTSIAPLGKDCAADSRNQTPIAADFASKTGKTLPPVPHYSIGLQDLGSNT
jgi:hypothetical protein